MHLTRGYSENWTRLLGVGSLLGAVIALAGCAAPTRYMGIDLTSPPSVAAAANGPSIMAATDLAALSLPDLARMAQGGSKQAQLELGIRFEEARGAERDLGKAKKLYRLAASDSLKDIEFFQPGNSNYSQQISRMKAGFGQDGLPLARIRLAVLESKEQ